MAITDRESAKAWLETQEDRRVHIAFATRAALRGLPAIVSKTHETTGGLALPVLRTILTSGVASTSPTPEVSAEIKATAFSAAFSACDWDARQRPRGTPVTVRIAKTYQDPLWPTEQRGDIPPGEPDVLSDGYGKLVAFFESDAET